MSQVATANQSSHLGLLSQNYFYVRRLHSLTGVLPLGIFLLDHFFTNAYSWVPSAFNEHVKALNQIPGVQMVEWMVIILPILFHGGLGLWMTSRMDVNQVQYGNFRNWMYLFQRISGAVVFLFIIFHLIHFRFGQEAAFKATSAVNYDPYKTIHDGLKESYWFVIPLYLVGIVASAFHFANGIWSFAITWGIAIGRRAQLLLSYASMLLFVGVSAFGIYALLGFLTTQP